jgi:caffeoyl-CoA O-methyltransferase
VRGIDSFDFQGMMEQGSMKEILLIISVGCVCLSTLLGGAVISVYGESPQTGLDAKVEKFLEAQRGRWRDWNVPYEDGKALFNVIVKNHYRRALEIGTSSGHSSIWIAWALSKTGGKLITIEIDKGRHRRALENFQKAGVESFIDARLGDAHRVVKELDGPFDFVFCDADKEWSTQYFKDVDPKLAAGGCFAAHNVTDAFEGIKEFLDYVRSLPNYQTTIDRSSSSGISISCKKR